MKARPVYFVQIKQIHEDTWMDSIWQDKIVPVVIDHSFDSEGRIIFMPFLGNDPLAPFLLPFNACISGHDVIPCTEEEAQAAYKERTGKDALPMPQYDPTPLRELRPDVIWYKEVTQ